MQGQEKQGHLPNLERLSLLVVTILLTYAMSQFLTLPRREISIQLPELYLSFQFSSSTVLTLIVAGLTATGANWLIRDHPGLGKRNTVEHWLLPAVTALVFAIPLFQ